MLPCYPKELLRKTSSLNLKKSQGSVGVAVKVEINKPLAEYPSATFAGVLAMKRINVSKKTFLTLAQVLRQESQTYIRIYVSFAMVVRLNSLVKMRGLGPHFGHLLWCFLHIFLRINTTHSKSCEWNFFAS